MAEPSNRDSLLSSLKLSWTVDETFTSLDNSDPDRESQYRLLAIQIADRFGIKDPVKREHFILQDIARARQEDASCEVKSHLPWTFESAPSTIEVTAQSMERSAVSKYHVLLGHVSRVTIQDEKVTQPDGSSVTPDPIVVLAAHSPAWCYRDAGLSLFSVSPEQICLFGGRDPIQMYGGKWSLVSDDGSSQVLMTAYEKGQGAPYSVVVYLDKLKGMCPSRITYNSKMRSEAYDVVSFQQYSGCWTPKEVNCTIEQRGMYHVSQTWHLVNISQSQPISVSLAANADVLDYRLLGPDVSAGGIIYDEQLPDHFYVPYQLKAYSFKLPTLDNLKSMRDRLGARPAGQHTSVKSSSAGFWLCLGLFSVSLGICLAFSRSKPGT